MEFIMMLVIGGSVGLGIAYLQKRNRKSKVAHLNVIEEISMGKYLAGFEDNTSEVDNVFCNVTNEEFLFYSMGGKKIGTIEITSITDIILDDKTSVGQRLTATRLLTLGVFSLAAPKKKKHKEYCIIFEWEDDNGEKNNVVFEFSGMACDVISKESFNKLNKYKPITTKKCPFCDETIRIKATICKYCNKELSSTTTTIDL